MSERTTDDALEQKAQEASTWHGEAVVWRDAALAARASEVAKDAVIEALADAVENLKAEVRRMATVGSAGFSCDVMDYADAALRLAGRR